MKKNLLIAMVLIGTTVFGQIPTNGLKAYYTFNGNANDMSGNGNNGTVNGPTLTTDRFGNSNSAYLFAGGTDNIEVPHNSSFNNDTGSICFWIKDNNIPNPHGSAIIYKDSQCNGLMMNENGGMSGVIDYACGSQSGMGQTSGLFDNQWHFIVFTYKSNNMRYIYSDGVVADSASIGTFNFTSTTNLRFGRAQDSWWDSFTGSLDDICIYNRVLTSAELQQLFTVSCSGLSSSITAYGNTTFCSGSNVLLTTALSFTGYQWQKNGVNISGATNYNYTGSTSGTYRCITTCGTSTATSNNIQLTKLADATVTVTSTGSTTFCAGGSTTLTGTNPGAGYTYQWYRGNISVNGATALNYVAANPGAYKIISKNTSTGCSHMSNSITTVVNCRIANPGLVSGNVEENRNLMVYPNPTNGSFTVELNDDENIEGNAVIELMNSMGQSIYQTSDEVNNGFLQKELDFGNKKNGLYILKVVVGDKVYESKIIVN